MTNAEAIETLRANYPDACYEQLREAVDAAIEVLKAQGVAGDLISRQVAFDAFMDAANDWWALDAEDINIVFQRIPPAQPERKRGEWIPHEDEDGEHYGDKCSECGEWYVMPYGKTNFCPNCGADLREESE